MDIKNKFILESAHITEVYGPVQALKNYLIKRTDNFIFIGHPFSYTKIKNSIAEKFLKGEKIKEYKTHKRSNAQFFQWIKDFFYNVFFILNLKEKIDIFIGIDNLNALTGIIGKKIRKIERVIYYVIDHTPKRFKNPFFNFLYEYADKVACEKSDEIWALSKRIADVKKEKFKISEKKIKIVPVGVELSKVDKYTLDEKLKSKSIVFVSYLDETKGCQLMIDAMAEIIQECKEVKLLIIGTGPYEEKLKEQVKNLKLENYVKFLGTMDHDNLFKFIPHHRIGIASYMDDPNSYTYYADPTKPKEYFACGLPVVITDIPWIAEEIKKRPMGVVCKYNKEELVNACVKLLKDDEFYKICLKNAEEFSKELLWDRIYDEAFGKEIK